MRKSSNSNGFNGGVGELFFFCRVRCSGHNNEDKTKGRHLEGGHNIHSCLYIYIYMVQPPDPPSHPQFPPPPCGMVGGPGWSSFRVGLRGGFRFGFRIVWCRFTVGLGLSWEIWKIVLGCVLGNGLPALWSGFRACLCFGLVLVGVLAHERTSRNLEGTAVVWSLIES